LLGLGAGHACSEAGGGENREYLHIAGSIAPEGLGTGV
jgi:hypothetical protein